MKIQTRQPSNNQPALPETDNQRIWAFERGRLWVKDLTQSRSTQNQVKLELEVIFSEIHKSDVVAISTAMGLSNTGLAANRLQSGRRCFVAWFRQKIVAYCWVSRFAECIGEIEHEIHFRPDEAYIWDCATLPDYRHKGIYSGLLRFISSTLKSDGIVSVWIGSSLDNYASMRGFSNAGFSAIATLVYFRFFQISVMGVFGVPSAPRAWVNSARKNLTSSWPHTIGPLVYGLLGGLPAPTEYRSPCSDEAA